MTRRRVFAFGCSAALMSLALSGCAGPAAHEYILGPATPPTRAAVVETTLPVVQIERVKLADYLDTREIVTRKGNEIVSSDTARWADRLSVGVGRALVASMAPRLQGLVVTSEEPLDPPAIRVVVEVTAFEATADQQVVLRARWAITDATGEKPLATQQVTLTQPVSANGGDGAIVTAMSGAVADLAERIAVAIAAVNVRLGAPTTSGAHSTRA